MSDSAICPKCKRQANFAFNSSLTERILRCLFCGFASPISNVNFVPEPQYLFKYRPHDEFSKSWILNEELFFCSPLAFNDPFDSKIFHTLDGDEKQKRKFVTEFVGLTFPKMKKRQRAHFVTKRMKTFSDEKYHEEVTQSLVGRTGILSLTTKCDDILMYSYYANNHTGYCLKYRRTAENVFSIAMPVIYSEKYPKFAIANLDSFKTCDYGRLLLFTKSKQWSHEQEWRVTFLGKANTVIKPGSRLLEGIILGCAMKPEGKREVIELNNQKEHPVPIFQAVKHKYDFALDIQPL